MAGRAGARCAGLHALVAERAGLHVLVAERAGLHVLVAEREGEEGEDQRRAKVERAW
jgi:hypothetical protein